MSTWVKDDKTLVDADGRTYSCGMCPCEDPCPVPEAIAIYIVPGDYSDLDAALAVHRNQSTTRILFSGTYTSVLSSFSCQIQGGTFTNNISGSGYIIGATITNFTSVSANFVNCDIGNVSNATPGQDIYVENVCNCVVHNITTCNGDGTENYEAGGVTVRNARYSTITGIITGDGWTSTVYATASTAGGNIDISATECTITMLETGAGGNGFNRTYDWIAAGGKARDGGGLWLSIIDSSVSTITTGDGGKGGNALNTRSPASAAQGGSGGNGGYCNLTATNSNLSSFTFGDGGNSGDASVSDSTPSSRHSYTNAPGKGGGFKTVSAGGCVFSGINFGNGGDTGTVENMGFSYPRANTNGGGGGGFGVSGNGAAGGGYYAYNTAVRPDPGENASGSVSFCPVCYFSGIVFGIGGNSHYLSKNGANGGYSGSGGAGGDAIPGTSYDGGKGGNGANLTTDMALAPGGGGNGGAGGGEPGGDPGADGTDGVLISC